MAKMTKRPRTIDASSLETLAKQYADLRYERDSAAKSMEAVRDQMLAEMEAGGQDSATVGTYSVVVSRPTSAVLDEPGLAAALGKRMWERITTRSLDKNKLDAYIKSGEIDPEVVAQHTEIIERNPSLRVTAKK